MPKSVRGESTSDLDPEILDGHEFQLEFLADGAISAAVLAKTPGGLALEFPLAGSADVRANHECEQMLGVDALGMSAGWKQRGKAHDCRPERIGTNSHSPSEGRREETPPIVAES